MATTPYPTGNEPDLFTVMQMVVNAVRTNAALDAALDGYLRHDADNVRARFLSRRRAYEVTVLLDARAFTQDGHRAGA